MARNKKIGKDKLFALVSEGVEQCIGSEKDCYKAKRELGIKNGIVERVQAGNNHKARSSKQTDFDMGTFEI